MSEGAQLKVLSKTLYGMVSLWTPPEPNEEKRVPIIKKRSFYHKMQSVSSFDDPDREIYIMKRLSPRPELTHPNIIKYYSSYLNLPLKYIDLHMEYAPGGDLFNKIEARKKPFPETQAKFYLLHILKALEHLHVVHRLSHLDLSLENLLLIPDPQEPVIHERVVLTDFGSTVNSAKNFRFVSSMRPGKSHYQAPEIHHLDAVNLDATQTTTIPSTTAVDIFAFGVIMFEILIAHPPFANALDARRYNIAVDPAAFHQLVPKNLTLSKDAIRIICWCLQKDPARRPSVSQLLKQPYFTETTPELKSSNVVV